MIQEDVNQKTVALTISTTKLTGRVLARAMSLYLRHIKSKQQNPKLHHGKQTLKQLMKHNVQLSNIEITDENIGAFKKTAKKYNIDYALKCNLKEKPPRYIVFFKGRDVDVINTAFKEFSAQILRQKEKPSLKSLIKEAVGIASVRNKEKTLNKDKEVSL